MRSALVVSGGGFQGQALVDMLACVDGVRTIVADLYAENINRHRCAGFVQVPPLADADGFAAALVAAINHHGVGHVFPATERELLPLSRLQAGLAASGVDVAVCDTGLLEALLDKERAGRLLADAGLPVQQPVAPAGHDFATPLFGKPRRGWGGHGTLVLRDAAGLASLAASGADSGYVWLPFVESFVEYSGDFCIRRDGAISPLTVRRRERTSGGYSIISVSERPEAVIGILEATTRLLRERGGRGLFNVQVIVPEGGQPFVSDVNPRVGTSAVHALLEGNNLAGFYIEPASPRPAPLAPVRSIRFLATAAIPVLEQRPRGLVLDLDDTLLDHKLWVASKLGLAIDAVASAWDDPETIHEVALRLIDEGERAALIDRLAAHFDWEESRRLQLLEAYRAATPAQAPLYPDVEPTLTALHQAGVRLALLTDNPVPGQRAKIAASPLLSSITTPVFSRLAGGEKPRLAAFQAAAAALDLPCSSLCMVGDNYFRDIVGACRAGFAHAFLLQRGGGFIQSHPALRRQLGLGLDEGKVHVVDNLYLVRSAILGQQ